MISLEKLEIFDTFTKIAWECGRFGQINCCQRLWKVAQSSINRPIWSHWLGAAILTAPDLSQRHGVIQHIQSFGRTQQEVIICISPSQVFLMVLEPPNFQSTATTRHLCHCQTPPSHCVQASVLEWYDQCLPAMLEKKLLVQGSGCGSVGRADAYNSRGLRFKSSHRQTFISNIYCQLYWKYEYKEKGAGNGPFFKKVIVAWV